MKFNKKSNTTKTINHMGSIAYEMNSKEKLYSMAATCLMNEPKYYGDTTSELIETAKAVLSKDPEFVLQLAAYCRKDLYLRSTPIALLVEAANSDGRKFVKAYAPFIITRADQITEALSYQLEVYKKPIPASLKKALANAFNSFDEYQLAKYNRDSKITFKDVIMLVHPKPKNEDQSKLFKAILSGTLKTPDTWEVQISKHGNQAKVWDRLITEKKLGYMATLRNLNNMIKANISQTNLVTNLLRNKDLVIRSKQMPHRFLSAYEKIDENKDASFESDANNTTMFKDALEDAIKLSVEYNIPKLSGKTIIACDNSGSARGDGGPWVSKLSLNSIRTMSDIGNLMGLLAWHSNENTMFSVFGDRLEFVRPDRSKGILENFKAVDSIGEKIGMDTEQGIFTLLKKMIKEKIQADRLIVISDLQIGDGNNREYGINYDKSSPVQSLLNQYKKEVNPNLIYYSICFSSYGTNVVTDQNVLIAGWNDKILNFINLHEQNKITAIQEIKSSFNMETLNAGDSNRNNRNLN